MKKSKHFKIQELVCPEVYKKIWRTGMDVYRSGIDRDA